MDEIKIKLTSRLTRKMVEKILIGSIRKKLGFAPKLAVNTVEVNMTNGTVYFHLDIDGSLSEHDLLRINRVLERS